MFPTTYGARIRPKSIGAIEQSIFNNAPPPHEILRYKYRKIFGLSAAEMDAEPLDEFYTNLYIYAQIKKKEELESKHGNS